MARNNRSVSYTPDAFDEPPEGPVGVHRGNPAWYAIILPYVVTLVIAVLAGLLVWAFASGEISHLSFPWNHSQQSSQSKVVAKKSDTTKPKSDDEDDSSDDSEKTEADSTNAEDTKDTKTDESRNNNEKNTDATTQSQAAVDKTVAVKVINATDINGHAAQTANTLKQAGYANVTAGNPTGKVPNTSVVWYKDDTQKAAAEDIAKTLGIAAVENEKGIVSQIVVVLCK